MQLSEVVPWGRSFSEYRRMFALTDADMERRILGCADGPASFNAELTARGGKIISVDPLYRFSRDQIAARIAETRKVVLQQLHQNRDNFIWRQVVSVDQLAELRKTAMEIFLSDIVAGLQEGRYLDAELPSLPFADGSFELALCSHFLFLYSEQLSLAFHRQALAELCRVARAVRVFPLLRLDGKPSQYLEPLMESFRADGYVVNLRQVDYELQKGGNLLLELLRDENRSDKRSGQ